TLGPTWAPYPTRLCRDSTGRLRPAKRIRGHTPHTASRPHAFLPAAPCHDASCEVSGDEVFDAEEASCGRVRDCDVPHVAGLEHACDRSTACGTVGAAREVHHGSLWNPILASRPSTSRSAAFSICAP